MTTVPVSAWRRIDIRSIPVEAIPWFINTFVGYLMFGSFFPPWIWAEVDKTLVVRGALVVAAWGLVRAVIRWATSFYLLDETRLRFRTGLFVRRRITVERSLIRNVGLRANLIAQMLRVTTVEASAAQHDNDVAIRIHSIPGGTARALRDELLPDDVAPVDAADDAIADPETLMEGHPVWSLFAPFSSASVGLWAGSYVLIYNVFFAWFAWIRTFFWLASNDIPWQQGVRALIVVPVVIGIIGAIVLYLEAWWRYRLERHPSGILRVSAGAVVRREVSFREDKIVGAEYSQPLATRFARRVRVAAVTTGAGSQRTLQLNLPAARKRILMPLGPAAKGQRTVQSVLHRQLDLADLVIHPVQARNQRLRWAIGGAALATLLVLLVLRQYAPDAVAYTWAFAGVALVVAVVLALDNYHALGHRVTPDLLISRWGTWQRRTSVIHHSAIVGWVFRQTYFQWRLGLVTMIASTAAGSGGYFLHAIGVKEGVAVAKETTPRLLEPFEREVAAPEPSGPAEGKVPDDRARTDAIRK